MHYIRLFLLRHAAPLLTIFISFAFLTLCAAILAGVGTKQPARKVLLPSVASAPATVKTMSVSNQLLATLPTADTDFIEALHRDADAVGVSLDEVSYQTDRERSLPVLHQQANFTLVDQYASIRMFLNLLTKNQRNIALEALSCTRDNIDATEVSCTIRVGAYFKVSNMAVAHGG